MPRSTNHVLNARNIILALKEGKVVLGERSVEVTNVIHQLWKDLRRLFEAQLAFEKCLEMDKSPDSMENVAQVANVKHLKRRNVLRKNDQFGRKSYQKSVKMLPTNFYKGLFKNMYVYSNCRLSKICLLHTYVMQRMFYFEWYCISYLTANFNALGNL